MKIKILNANSENCNIGVNQYYRSLFNTFASVRNDNLIEWGNEGSILAVTNQDLTSLQTIDWHEINLIFAENCQQIFDFAFLLDMTKSYIFVTESFVDFEILKKKFMGFPLLAHYCVLNEVFEYGSLFFNANTYYSLIEQCSIDANFEYDFFCLIGRPSGLRNKFIHALAKKDLSRCLVKYNGKVWGTSGADPRLDALDYQNGFFNNGQQIGLQLPSKMIQASLYQNFRAEIQFETDAIGGQGWDIPEFHVTEKTLKPLLMSKPCMMFGPPGYLSWLLTQGIDLGHGCFDQTYDHIVNDSERLYSMIDVIDTVNWEDVKPNANQLSKNILGLHKLSQLSKTACVDLYKKLLHLG